MNLLVPKPVLANSQGPLSLTSKCRNGLKKQVILFNVHTDCNHEPETPSLYAVQNEVCRFGHHFMHQELFL